MPSPIRVDYISKLSGQIWHSGAHERVCEFNHIKPRTSRLHLYDAVRGAVSICCGVSNEEGYDHYRYLKTILSRDVREPPKRKAQPPDAVSVAIVNSGRVFRRLFHEIQELELVVTDGVNLMFILVVKDFRLVHMT